MYTFFSFKFTMANEIFNKVSWSELAAGGDSKRGRGPKTRIVVSAN